MKQLYGWLIFAWIAFEQIIKLNQDFYSIASLLGALCLFIMKEKFFKVNSITVIYLFLVSALSFYNIDFILLSGIPIIDFAFRDKLPAAFLILSVLSLISIENGIYANIFFLVSAGLFGYMTGIKSRNESEHLSLLDEERRLRYNLERVQNELINSRNEIEQMTEIRERNRIAHEIHDNIGHGIAGVIFQLEGARRILKKDIEKAEDVLKLCSSKLSETLELTRNTVYNIKVDKRLGIDAIEKIIKDYRFCTVLFERNGDFSGVTMSNMKILEANVMECLTNASKYSKASEIHIQIDIGRKNIRFYYKDNGIGCSEIKENLGISGMRQRVRNVGGTISIDGNDGFLIVCTLPVIDSDKRDGESS